MESFLYLLEDTKKELGRELQKREIEFLQWVYDRHKEENKIEEHKHNGKCMA